MTSPRRQPAMTGTSSSSASRTRSFDVRARRTPAPARMTGRSRRGEELEDGADVVRLRPGRRGRGRCRAPCPRAGPRRGGPPGARGGPGRAGRQRGADRVADRGRDVGRASAARRRARRGRRSSPPGRSPGTPRGRGSSRSTWPTSANIGVESWRAVWMPIARFAAPTARVAEAGGRAAGELGVGLGHERGGALVAGRDDADAGGLEALEQAEEALARDGEGLADAGGAKRVGEEPADGPRRRRQRLRRGSARGRPRSARSARRRARRLGRLGRARRRARLGARPPARRVGSLGSRLGRRPAPRRASGSGSATSVRRPARRSRLRLGARRRSAQRLGLGRGASTVGRIGLASDAVGSVVVSVASRPVASRSSGRLRPAPSVIAAPPLARRPSRGPGRATTTTATTIIDDPRVARARASRPGYR